MAASSRLTVFVALLAAGTLLGMTTVLAKLAASAGVPPVPFLAWSALGAAALLGSINVLRGAATCLDARVVEYFVMAGVLSFALPNALLFSAIPHVGAGFASLALALPPTLTYAGAVLLGMDRLDAPRALAVALALAGAAMLAVAKGLQGGVPHGWLAVTLVVPIVLAAGNLYRTRRWPPGASPSGLAPGVLAASAFLLLLVGATPALAIGIPDARPLAILLLATQAAVFAGQYALFFFVQQQGGPVYLSLIGSVAAMVAVPLSIAILDEPPPRLLMPAAVLVLAALALLASRRYSAASPSR